MFQIIAQSTAKIIRWVIYLAFFTEVGACAHDLKFKAGKSVQTGLISLEAINSSLHSR